MNDVKTKSEVKLSSDAEASCEELDAVRGGVTDNCTLADIYQAAMSTNRLLKAWVSLGCPK